MYLIMKKILPGMHQVTRPEILKEVRDTYSLVFSDLVYSCPCLITG